MNKATRDKITRKAAETVKSRHGIADAVAKVGSEMKAAGVKPVKVEKAEKVAKKPTGLPDLPPMPSIARARKDRPVKPCACGGCGQTTKSQWAPGHDAYCNGWALRVEREICKLKDVPKEVLAGVKLRLTDRAAVAEANPHIKPKLTVVKSEKVEETPEPVIDPAVGE